MKIRLTDPFTGRTRTHRAHLTTDHPCSSYGAPVLLVGDSVLDAFNVVIQRVILVEPPKRKDQVKMFAQWQANIQALKGER
jgi:hypothetical protein